MNPVEGWISRSYCDTKKEKKGGRGMSPVAALLEDCADAVSCRLLDKPCWRQRKESESKEKSVGYWIQPVGGQIGALLEARRTGEGSRQGEQRVGK